MVAPAYVSVTTATQAVNTADHPVSLPSGSGGILVLTGTSYNDQSVVEGDGTPPSSDWTLRQFIADTTAHDGTNGPCACWMWTKPAEVGDGTFTWHTSTLGGTGGDYYETSLQRYTHPDGPPMVNAVATPTEERTSSSNVPAITTLINDCVIIAAKAGYSKTVSTPPSGYTQRANYDTSMYLWDAPAATAGTFGPTAYTNTGVDQNVNLAIALSPPTVNVTLKFSNVVSADVTQGSHSGTADCGTVINDSLLIVAVGSTTKFEAGGSPISDPTKSSGTATIGTVTEITPRGTFANDDMAALQCWRIPVTGGGTLVLSIGDDVDTWGFGVQVVQIEGHDPTTPIAGAVADHESASGQTTFNPTTITLAATPTVADVVLAFAYWDSTNAAGKGIVAGTNATLLTPTVVGTSSDFVEMNGQSRTGSTSTTVTWPTTDTTPSIFSNGGMAFIVKAASFVVSTEQEGFRFRNDDGSETSATWKAAQDTNSAVALNTNVRLRALVNAAGDTPSTAYRLDYKLSTDGAYVAVPVGAAALEPFPTIEGVAESSVNTAGTSHAVTLPASIASTDLVLIIMDIGSTSATLNALTDWTESLDEASANGLKIIRYTGAGVPTTPTFTSSATTRSASIAYRISGADKAIAPQIGTTATGTSTTPDPPSVTPTGGTSKSYLFIAFYGAAGEEADDDTWSDTPPTNYGPTPPLQKACGTAGTNLGGMIAAASRQLATGSAENPGTFAKDVSAAWRAQTIIIHPPTPVAPPIYVSPSANITAGGEATTAQLTAPSGKTTSDFTTGRMWDNENGTDSIDIASNFYTELEWCLQAQSPAVDGQIYQFRVTANGTVLDTYTVTPELTIGSVTAASRPIRRRSNALQMR